MFIAIPHSAEFRWGRVPWLVLGLMMLCTLIYYAEDNNKEKLRGAFKPYCESIHDPEVDADDIARTMYSDVRVCNRTLSIVHRRPDKERFFNLMLEEAEGEIQDGVSVAEEEKAYIRDVYMHYQKVRYTVPESLDAKLMAEPLFFNPLRSISSALAHGDWWHLIGNMIFFFAFAPALEMVIGSRLRFLAAMIIIAIACDLAYFLSVHLFDEMPLAALGFSGVVSGMIGMSGYLLPRVKVRMFVWVIFYARNVYIPAGILAAWYIGWDAWYMLTDDGSSGINFVAHVFGGVTGYFLARYWFRELKEEIRHDVADEVEYHRALRNDRLGVLSSYRSSRPYLAEANREQRAKREFSNFVAQIYKAVSVDDDALAINLLLSRYDDYRHAIELYEEIYQEMLQWRPTRAVLCLSRLLIHEYIQQRKYARAMEVARKALQITPEFVFAEEGQRELLESMARRQRVTLT